MKPSALILDRDGTVFAMVPNSFGVQDSAYYPHQVELYPELHDLLRPWARAEIPIFLATNQPGIAKGHFSTAELALMQHETHRFFDEISVPLKEIFSCIHHPVGTPQGDQKLIGPCPCRKPEPGLFWQIRDKHGVDLSKAIMVGDSSVDVEAAEKAGLKWIRQVYTFVSETVPLEKRKIANPQAPSFRDVMQELAGELL